MLWQKTLDIMQKNYNDLSEDLNDAAEYKASNINL